MKKTFILIVIIAIYSITNAQIPSWQWAKGAGGTGYEEGNSVATDDNGNILVTGTFAASVITFGNYTLGNLSSYSDIFLVKYDATGNVLWAKRAGGNSVDICNSVATDANGNILVTGHFASQSITFGSYTLTNLWGGDIFLAKYDPNGNVLWAKRAGGTSTDNSTNVATDNNGNILVTGYFQYSCIFGNDTLTSGGDEDMFLAKYDANGNVLWATSAGGTEGDIGLDVATDTSGNILVTGSFASSSITFGNYTFTNATMFLVKYDTNGNILWATSAGGTGNSVATDSSENIFVTGSFGDSITFGSYTLTSLGGTDMFLVKYDAAGNVLWATSAGGGGGFTHGQSIAVDPSGSIVITGYLRGPSSTTFGTYILTNTDTIGYTDDAFIVKYDPSGNVLWAASAYGTDDDRGYGVATDVSGNIFVAGYFESPSFIFGSYALVNVGYTDIFLAKLSPCGVGISVSSTNVLCNGGNDGIATVSATVGTSPYSYLWSNSEQTPGIDSLQKGTYYVTITDSNGCVKIDSVIITEPPLLINNISSAICSGDSVFLQGNYQTTTGIYYDTLASVNGCDSIIVTSLIINPVTSSPASSDTAICNDSVIPDLFATGTNIQWYSDSALTSLVFIGNSFTTGETSIGIHTYYATETQNGCESPATTVRLIIYENPAVPTIAQNGTTLTSSSATGNQWYLNSTIISGASSQNYIVTQNGNYTVSVTDSNGCSSSSAPYNFTTIGIDELITDNPIVIPNPNNGQFHIHIDKFEGVKIKIYNFIGEIIYESGIDNFKIDLSKHPKGIYSIEIITQDKSFNKKLIIQ